jgi:hypothetical protein
MEFTYMYYRILFTSAAPATIPIDHSFFVHLMG